ncbi:nuclear transport factor 2 family protein [Flagellimonas hymeniacidonis]|uniref:Nuclear transport factor 2 family protein n=1 Tax=Flagellimonas hymeniacidonis TaxID=2603628 RepID=A0A5C8V2T6_9FLAO|nr:nuclear transport factor 2 family protein [Flagellimonas hymeniacidonis]TXN36073.1 nuclear transport factor 2 family protein [Flagellimonas hymeniacidonis]
MILLSAATYAQAENERNTDLVGQLSETYRSAVLEENTDALINMLHPEVMFHPPSGGAFSGKDIVGKLIISFLDKNDVTSWKVNIDKRANLGNSLVEFGNFEIVENGETTSKRKYINIWSTYKGEYKLFFRGWSPL